MTTRISGDYSPNLLVYSCTGVSAQYVTLRLINLNVPLTICEAMVFDFNKKPTSILSPVLADYGACPSPLAGACEAYESQGMAAQEAAIKAFMEGPIACEKGFFCRMKAIPAGIEGGITGSEGDQFANNRNYGYW